MSSPIFQERKGDKIQEVGLWQLTATAKTACFFLSISNK